MFDRRWLGDLALAVLLILPLTGLAGSRPATLPTTHNTAPNVSTANLSPGGRVGLLG